MMDSIRRRLSKSPGGDPWSTDLAFEPEAPEESELQLDRSVLITTSRARGGPSPNEANLRDYYKGLVLAAIDQGGNFRGQQISIPWLRMTLAGLEMRPIPSELMWEGEPEDFPAEMPGYEKLFPEDRMTKQLPQLR
ncbi:MAG: hypothetical protein JRM99_01335 [Nitrososphaerota archaeon]|nr:hypothetical protein [Nitrososphaerota archaeon]